MSPTNGPGTLRQIKDLTLYMLERHRRLDGFGVETIEAGRHMLSPRWQQRLSSLWGADIIPVYGFSELSMCNARKCRHCTYYHLPPTCIGEVVDLSNTDRYTAAGGRGSIVVTAFYPYVQLEPRIRYRPGDCVELAKEPCSIWGELGFRPLGREEHCFMINEGTVTITPADCFAVLADLPQVAVRRETSIPAELDFQYDESGSPRFSLQCINGSVELHVELRFDPRIWEDEAAIVERIIRRSLGSDISVVLHGPGRLANIYFS